MTIKSILRYAWGTIFLGIALMIPNLQAHSGEVGVTDTTIKIALMVPLTGPAGATVGPGMSAGARTVWTEINEKGGIHGRKIEWVEVDTGCTAEMGIPAAKRAIFEEDVFMLASGGCSNEILSYRDIVNENGVPFSVWGATNDKITAQPNCCIFRTSLRAGYEGVLQADFANSIPGAKRFAIIAQHDAWGQAKYDGVMNQLKKLGIEVIADEEMTVETADATPQVLRIAKAEPDVIITDLYPKPTNVFLRAAHQYGLTKKQILLHTSINDLVELDKTVALPGAVDNAYTVTYTRDPNAPDLAGWNDRLAKVAPEIKLTPYAMWGVTGAQVVAEALEKAGRDLTRESLLKAMRSIKGFESEMIVGPIDYTEDYDGNKTGMFQKLHNGKMVDVGITYKDIK
ncbi:MAG: ABC transporter substrate-binding protein [Pseudomonadota bacterium]|nr:ABC transporter substrate-binding protein [Pseudomonadota bacterium]